MGTGLSKSPPGRIIMVGLDAAGKTTLLYQMKRGEVTTTIPTIGFNLESLSLSRRTDLLTWDVGGRSPIRSLWRHYFQGVQGLVFVVDSADRERLEQAAEELEKMASEEALRDVPLLLLANKADLPGAASLAEVAAAMRLAELRRPPQSCASFAVCAVTFQGVAEAFEWLAERVKVAAGLPGSPWAPGKANPPAASGTKLYHLAESLLPRTLQRALFS